MFRWRRTRAKKERDIMDALVEPMTSSQIGKKTNLWSSSLYPVLYDLESRGIITSRWSTGPYPRRVVYERRAGTEGADGG
jgi:hypothetical protein